MSEPSAENHAAPPPPGLSHPYDNLIRRLVGGLGYREIGTDNLEEFVASPIDSILFFTEDPMRYPETFDVAVILPELLKQFAGRFQIGVVNPEAGKKLQPRFGFIKWPSLVFMRGGKYVGVISGLRDWEGYLSELQSMLETPAGRAPSIGIPVQRPASHPGHDCH